MRGFHHFQYHEGAGRSLETVSQEVAVLSAVSQAIRRIRARANKIVIQRIPTHRYIIDVSTAQFPTVALRYPQLWQHSWANVPWVYQ